MSIKSILSDIGSALEKVVTGPITALTNIAKSEEKVVDAAFPGIATIYNNTVNAVGEAETIFIAAGQQSGTGTQKLAYVVSSIEDDFNEWWQGTLGNTEPAAVTIIEGYVNSVVAGLNALPSSTSATTGTSTETAA